MIKTYSAALLKETKIERPLMIVDGLLPVGLTVLAGSPKLGKSWLALGLCAAVARQEPFLGHQTYEGEVLYMDLEGGQYRLQERLAVLGCGYPQNLKITHEAPRIGEGLLEELEEWWSCADFIPKLIVIDTVARVKGRPERGLNAYEADTRMFGQFQKFALEKKISIVCITHLRKQNNFSGSDPDWLERISGSMGLSGCADCVWGLFRSRGSDTAYLRTSARDVSAGDLVLRFNDGVWNYVSDDVVGYEFKQTPLVRFIDDLGGYHTSTATDLCAEYINYCNKNGLSHNLSGGQPTASFGKQMKAIQKELWRIRKSVSIEHKRNGAVYSITKF